MTKDEDDEFARIEMEQRMREALVQPAQEPVASEKIHDLQTMLDVLRIKQTVKFDDCSALFGEVARKTGMKPPPFELSGNQWCALVNLAVAKFAAPPAAQPAQEPVQVSPLEFVTMAMEKEHLIGNPIIWAQWPNKEKNT